MTRRFAYISFCILFLTAARKQTQREKNDRETAHGCDPRVREWLEVHSMPSLAIGYSRSHT